MTDTIDLAALAPPICDIARRAGREILAVRARGITVETKDDRSPVTEADLAANRVIVDGLRALTPDIPIVSEESTESVAAGIPDNDLFWLVDPLDGTKEFIKNRDEFTVNIALIENSLPVLGVVQLPAKDVLVWGYTPGQAFRRQGDGPIEPIHVRAAPADGATVVASRSHFSAETEAWLKSVRVAGLHQAGSSYKFCVVALGEADLYPRFGPTMEWDTAAGHAVLLAAGGSVRTPDDEPFLYGKTDFRNGFFIARGA